MPVGLDSKGEERSLRFIEKAAGEGVICEHFLDGHGKRDSDTLPK